MRSLAVCLLLWSGLAVAQIGNFPPLVGQRGTAAAIPVNCSVGQLYFATDATAGQNIYQCASANTWTQQLNSGGGITVGTTAITGGTTTRILYDNAGVVGESANLTFDSSGPYFQVGSGATTSVGLKLGYSTFSGYGAIFGLNLTPDSNNYALAVQSGNATVILNANADLYLARLGVGIVHVGSTAGSGIDITAGTAASAVSAETITQTWNYNTAAITGVKWTFTDTSSHANTLAFQILCGASGTTNCLSVPKEGGIAFAAKAISGTAPTLASGGCTSPTAVTSNGTAAFSVGVGTSCSGSQPLVFTLPAATTGWQCTARNQTSPTGSSPAMSSTVSTTSVTITNYSRTLGTAAAWTDSDVVVVSCMGY